MLLAREEVDPDKGNNFGQTPLAYAAKCGHEGVVKALLQRKEVNPNSQTRTGNTPLMQATRGGYMKVVALLQPHDKAITPSAS